MAPDEIFSALHREADATCGARLFTITVLDNVAGVARRAYSSHPVEYPVTGTKPMQSDPWSDRVLGRGESFIANETAEFSPFFPDHALINSLGCESAMNIPVAEDGAVVCTVNILDKAGHFTPERVSALQALVEARRTDLLAALANVPMEETK